jgi:glycosyltransferase
LLDCLNSIAQQTYTHREHVVVDGASTDGTVDIINQQTNQITSFITEPDKGIYDALNKGLKTLEKNKCGGVFACRRFVCI